MGYVNGLGVHAIERIDPPPGWEYVTPNRGTRLPTFQNSDLGVGLRIFVDTGGAAFVGKKISVPGGASKGEVFTAHTDRSAAQEAVEFMQSNQSGGAPSDLDFS